MPEKLSDKLNDRLTKDLRNQLGAEGMEEAMERTKAEAEMLRSKYADSYKALLTASLAEAIDHGVATDENAMDAITLIANIIEMSFHAGWKSHQLEVEQQSK